MWDLVPWPGINPRPPVLGAQNLSHWTTSELPRWSCFNPAPFPWSLVLWSDFPDSSSEWFKAELVSSPGHQTLPSSGVSLISLILLVLSHLLALLVIFSLFSPSVMSNSLPSHGLQHTRLPCPSLSPRVCSNSCPLIWWGYLTISSSVAHFSTCPQSFPPSGSFLRSRLFASSGQNIGASASIFPVNVQDWFPLCLISPIRW